jgi:hypothetical protein
LPIFARVDWPRLRRSTSSLFGVVLMGVILQRIRKNASGRDQRLKRSSCQFSVFTKRDHGEVIDEEIASWRVSSQWGWSAEEGEQEMLDVDGQKDLLPKTRSNHYNDLAIRSSS